MSLGGGCTEKGQNCKLWKLVLFDLDMSISRLKALGGFETHFGYYPSCFESKRNSAEKRKGLNSCKTADYTWELHWCMHVSVGFTFSWMGRDK